MRTRIALVLGAALVSSAAMAQPDAASPYAGDWPLFAHDLAGDRYSPLDQINAGNVKTLQVVWRWKAQNMGPAPQGAWEPHWCVERVPAVVCLPTLLSGSIRSCREWLY